MTGRDLYGVVVRSIGLVLVLWGIYAAAYTLGYPLEVGGTQAGFILAGGLAGAGLYMLWKAEHIVAFTYGVQRRPWQCEACGYDLRGSTGSCPECGAPRPPAGSSTPAQP